MTSRTGLSIRNWLNELQVTRCRLQDAGYKMQVTGCRLQDAGYRMQVTRCRLQDQSDTTCSLKPGTCNLLKLLVNS